MHRTRTPRDEEMQACLLLAACSLQPAVPHHLGNPQLVIIIGWADAWYLYYVLHSTVDTA